jgi:predicted nucleic acid-binding protein
VKLLADTSALLALLLRDDRHHAVAVAGSLLDSRRYEVLFADTSLVREALERLGGSRTSVSA